MSPIIAPSNVASYILGGIISLVFNEVYYLLNAAFLNKKTDMVITTVGTPKYKPTSPL